MSRFFSFELRYESIMPFDKIDWNNRITRQVDSNNRINKWVDFLNRISKESNIPFEKQYESIEIIDLKNESIQ